MTIALLAAASSVHTVRWANAFAQRGHAVHLITQHPPTAEIDGRVKVHPLPHWSGLGYVLNGGRVRRLLRKIGPDVVNAHYATGYGLLARQAAPFPLVMNVWGSDVFEFPARSAFHRDLVLTNLRKADHLVSTSTFMAAHTRTLGDPLPPITVVPFGVDPDVFHPSDRPRGSRPAVIGTVKTLAPKYGIDILIRAFAMLVATEERPVRLRIVGGGPQGTELMRLITALGISDKVDLIGPVPHARVPHELRQMDVFAALSRADSETFGVAVIEASACALPVLVSDAGGLPEVVRDGVTGFVVPREQVAATAARLRELITTPELRHAMGEAGRAHVAANYAWPACVDRQLDVFEKVMANTHGR